MLKIFYLLALLALPVSAQTPIHYSIVLRSPKDSIVVMDKLSQLGATSIQVVGKGKAILAIGPIALNTALNNGALGEYGIGQPYQPAITTGKLKATVPVVPSQIRYYAIVNNANDTTIILQQLKMAGADSFTIHFPRVIRFAAPYSFNLYVTTQRFKPLAMLYQDKIAFIENVSSNKQGTPDWGVTFMHAPDAWGMGATGQGKNTLDLDTGYGLNPYVTILGGQAIPYFNLADSNNYADDNGACDGHGTHTAGTIAGNMASGVGVAPNAGVYVGKLVPSGAVANGSCAIYSSAADEMLTWAVSHPEKHFVAYNMSYAGGGGPVEQTMAELRVAGIIGCAAMGNDGSTTASYPAANSSALGISGISSDGTLASWSTHGIKTFFGLPGNGINSLAPGGGFAQKSGTSMATPHCTGSMAVVRSADSTLTGEQAISLLCNTADILGNSSDPGMPYHDDYYGCGNIRLDRAVYALQHPFQAPSVNINIGLGKTDSILVPTGANWTGWGDAPWLHTVRHGNYMVITVDTISTHLLNYGNPFPGSTANTFPILGATATIKFGTIVQ